MGEAIKGPTAFGDDRRRMWRLAWTLAVTDFKLRFFGSVLGYVWALMRPLLLFAVIYVVFAEILKVGGDQPYFGVALLLGIVLFQFFTDATTAAVRSLILRENLVRKIEFPRIAVPLSCVLQAMMNLAINLVPVVIFLLAAGGGVNVRWLEMPLILLLLVVFTLGTSLLLAALFVRYRDVEPIWDVVLQALFYATPILYSLTLVIEKVGIDVARVMLINPIATAIQQARHAMVDYSYESAGQIFGSTAGNLIPIGVAVATLVLGTVVFVRAAPRVAEDL
jgi:ABC-2 type transport system permease protein